MRFTHLRHPHRRLDVELTPMIDVVFLLIIFFMITAQFARLTRADVDLPIEKGEQSEAAEEAGLVINIDRDGRLIVAERSIELEELEAIVRDEVRRQPGQDAKTVKLMIRADRAAATDRLNQVVTALQQMGVGAARLATEIP